MKWYLTLVQQRHDKPKSRRIWVLVSAEDAMSARSEGALVALMRWPLCRGCAAIIVSARTATACRRWLQSGKPFRPLSSHTSELTVAFDALFCHGKRHQRLDAEMVSRWSKKPLMQTADDCVRPEEEI